MTPKPHPERERKCVCEYICVDVCMNRERKEKGTGKHKIRSRKYNRMQVVAFTHLVLCKLQPDTCNIIPGGLFKILQSVVMHLIYNLAVFSSLLLPR